MFLIKTEWGEEYARAYCDYAESSSFTKNADGGMRFKTEREALAFINEDRDLYPVGHEPEGHEYLGLGMYVVECEWRSVRRRCIFEKSVPRLRAEECPICKISKTKRRANCCQQAICMKCEKTCRLMCPFCRANK